MAVATAAGAAVTSNGDALTTTFTPPAPCATQFMMLEIDQFRIWMNPVTPASGIVATSCYASQWLESSSAEALDPFVCPSGYQTQTTFDNPAGYIACCPSGFDGLALNTNAPASRPASGATCYTNIYNSGILVTEYDSSSATTTTIYTATDSSAQAYASPYDGFRAAAAATSTTTTSNTSGKSTSSTTATPGAGSKSHSGISSGAIAGAVIACVAGIALIISVIAFLLARRRRRRGAPPPPVEMAADSVGGGTYERKNAKLVPLLGPGELAGDEHRAEMAAPVSELPGSEVQSSEPMMSAKERAENQAEN